jgi:hypothetical protein
VSKLKAIIDSAKRAGVDKSQPPPQMPDEAARQGIRAYHGSPHSFDKFSTSQIGTGEGAQAYGRGLYFAEREKTAEGYRKKLSRDNLAQRAKDNQSYDTLVGLGLDESPELGAFSIILSEADGDMARAIQDSMTPRYPDDPLPAFAQSMADAMKSGRLPASIELPTLNKGSMYEVNIAATPDEFIDWDLPLDEQSESVMNALNKTDWYQYAEEGAINAAERRGDNAYGMDLVRWLEEDGAEDAAQMLKDAGIKGIQYADAQTRFGKGPKTKNYVVYDDKLITSPRSTASAFRLPQPSLAGTMTPEEAQAGVISTLGELAKRADAGDEVAADALAGFTDYAFKVDGAPVSGQQWAYRIGVSDDQGDLIKKAVYDARGDMVKAIDNLDRMENAGMVREPGLSRRFAEGVASGKYSDLLTSRVTSIGKGAGISGLGAMAVLPPEEAQAGPLSAAGRAAQKGFTKDVYHGTTQDFDQVDPDAVDLGIHVGTPAQAANRLRDTTGNRFSGSYDEGANIMPLKARMNNTLEMEDAGDWKDSYQVLGSLRNTPVGRKNRAKIQEMEEQADEIMGQYAYGDEEWRDSPENRELLDEINTMLADSGYDSIRYKNQVENTYGSSAGLTPQAEQRKAAISKEINALDRKLYARKPDMPAMDDPDLAAKMDAFLSFDANKERTPADAARRQQLLDENMAISADPANQADTNSYIILDPDANLRSRNAQFMDERGNLLASVGTGLGLGVGAAFAPEKAQASEYPSLGGKGVTSAATPDEVAFKAPREPRRIPPKQPPGIASLAGQLGLGAMSEIAGAIFGGLAGAAEYGRGSGPSMGGMAGAPATAESIRNINEGVSGYVGDLYDAGPEAQALGQQIMQGIGETIAPIAEYAMEGDITDEYGINMLPLLAQKLGIPLYELLERVYSMMPEREQEALKSGADAFL